MLPTRCLSLPILSHQLSPHLKNGTENRGAALKATNDAGQHLGALQEITLTTAVVAEKGGAYLISAGSFDSR